MSLSSVCGEALTSRSFSWVPEAGAVGPRGLCVLNIGQDLPRPEGRGLCFYVAVD